MFELIKENLEAFAVLFIVAIGANLIFGVSIIFVLLFLPLAALFGVIIFSVVAQLVGPELAGFGLWPFAVGGILAGVTLSYLPLAGG